MNLRYKPVVAFDVDGVLRVRPLKDFADDFVRREITLYRNDYPDIFHGEPRWDSSGKDVSDHYFSPHAINLIKDLAARDDVEVVWATTWQDWANRYFGQALDIPFLKSAVNTLEPLEANYYHCSPSWKTAQLSRQFDGRPLLWIDDNMPDRPGENLDEQRRPFDRAITRSYQTNHYTGITPKDSEEILQWISKVSSVGGQKELREERNREQRKIRNDLKTWQRKRNKSKEISAIVKAKVLEIYEGQEYLANELGSMATSRYGLTAENVAYALTRMSIKADPEELAAKLRVKGYHFRKELS